MYISVQCTYMYTYTVYIFLYNKRIHWKVILWVYRYTWKKKGVFFPFWAVFREPRTTPNDSWWTWPYGSRMLWCCSGTSRAIPSNVRGNEHVVAEIKPGWACNSEIIHLLGPGSKYFLVGPLKQRLVKGHTWWYPGVMLSPGHRFRT